MVSRECYNTCVSTFSDIVSRELEAEQNVKNNLNDIHKIRKKSQLHYNGKVNDYGNFKGTKNYNASFFCRKTEAFPSFEPTAKQSKLVTSENNDPFMLVETGSTYGYSDSDGANSDQDQSDLINFRSLEKQLVRSDSSEKHSIPSKIVLPSTTAHKEIYSHKNVGLGSKKFSPLSDYSLFPTSNGKDSKRLLQTFSRPPPTLYSKCSNWSAESQVDLGNRRVAPGSKILPPTTVLTPSSFVLPATNVSNTLTSNSDIPAYAKHGQNFSEELQTKLQTLIKENVSLVREVERLKDDLSVLGLSKDKLKQELTNSMVAKHERRVRALKEEFDFKLEEEKRIAQEITDTGARKIQQLEAEIRAMETSHQLANEKFKSEERHVSILIEQNKSLEEQSTAALKTVTQFSEKNMALTKELDEARNKFALKETLINRLECSLQQAETDVEAAKAVYLSQQKELTSLSLKLADQMQENDTLNEIFKEKDNDQTNLSRKIVALENALKDQHICQGKMESEMRELQRKNDLLSSQCTALNQRAAEYLHIAERCTNEGSSLKQENILLRQRLEEQQESLRYYKYLALKQCSEEAATRRESGNENNVYQHTKLPFLSNSNEAIHFSSETSVSALSHPKVNSSWIKRSKDALLDNVKETSTLPTPALASSSSSSSSSSAVGTSNIALIDNASNPVQVENTDCQLNLQSVKPHVKNDKMGYERSNIPNNLARRIINKNDVFKEETKTTNTIKKNISSNLIPLVPLTNTKRNARYSLSSSDVELLGSGRPSIANKSLKEHDQQQRQYPRRSRSTDITPGLSMGTNGNSSYRGELASNSVFPLIIDDSVIKNNKIKENSQHNHNIDFREKHQKYSIDSDSYNNHHMPKNNNFLINSNENNNAPFLSNDVSKIDHQSQRCNSKKSLSTTMSGIHYSTESTKDTSSLSSWSLDNDAQHRNNNNQYEDNQQQQPNLVARLVKVLSDSGSCRYELQRIQADHQNQKLAEQT